MTQIAAALFDWDAVEARSDLEKLSGKTISIKIKDF